MELNNEIREININNERIFLKKSKIFGWGIVKPIKIDGKINWKNLLIGGSWIKLGILLFVLFVLYGVAQEYSTAIKIAQGCADNINRIIIN